MPNIEEFVRGLRNAADFFESHPELGAPYENELAFHYYIEVAGQRVDSVYGLRAFTNIVGGHLDKSKTDENYFRLVAQREGFSVTLLATRNAVCERVQVGSKFEPAHTVPAQPAQPEQLVPEREIPIYEYRCPTILAPVEFPVEPLTL